jgi:hypothetical protein
MSRAYVIYICVAALLIAGLWVILAFGQALEAPPDLSGTWKTKWDSPPPFADQAGRMKVEQSGRFLQVSFDKSAPMSFKLDEDFAKTRELRNPVRRMRNQEWTLSLIGNVELGDVRIELDGRAHCVGTATPPKSKQATTQNAR